MIAWSKAWLKPPVQVSCVFWHPMCVGMSAQVRGTRHATRDDGGSAKMRRLRLLVGVLSIGAAAPMAACTHTAKASGDVAPATAIGLRVRNDNFLDMDVCAIS